MTETKEDSMRDIVVSLDEIKSILKLVNHEKLEQIRNALLKEGSIKKQIYDLCDGFNTTQDIATSLQKEPEYVRSYISTLRREGLVRTVERHGKLVHEQVF